VKRWLFTGLSFAAVVGVSVYAVWSSAPHGSGVTLRLPYQAHLLAFGAFATEIIARALKLTWSAKAVGTKLPVSTSLRTSLGGDFAASITPARVGAEPSRFLILKVSGIQASEAMVILYMELFLEMLSLAAVLIAMMLLFDASNKVFAAMIGVVGAYATFILGLGVFGYVLSRRNLGNDAPGWARTLHIHGKRWELLQRWFGKIRVTVDAFRGMHKGWATAALFMSVFHVAIRFTILPAIVYTATDVAVPLAPLVIWPLGLVYGVGVLPAPGGGGAVELAFRAALDSTIPAQIFAASLVWWRFYTFYIYILIGGLVAGNIALRAVRDTEEAEEEFERAES
jgi:uncharacterized protein (TIRG00374 family)